MESVRESVGEVWGAVKAWCPLSPVHLLPPSPPPPLPLLFATPLLSPRSLLPPIPCIPPVYPSSCSMPHPPPFCPYLSLLPILPLPSAPPPQLMCCFSNASHITTSGDCAARACMTSLP